MQTACQHQQVSEEVWLVLQNAAAHTDPDTRCVHPAWCS